MFKSVKSAAFSSPKFSVASPPICPLRDAENFQGLPLQPYASNLCSLSAVDIFRRHHHIFVPPFALA
jgi:hypothetical protein